MDLKDKLKSAAHSLGTVVSNAVNGEDILVDEQTYMKRMAACQGCPEYNKALGQCKSCGCFVKTVKGKLAGMECPLHKWPK